MTQTNGTTFPTTSEGDSCLAGCGTAIWIRSTGWAAYVCQPCGQRYPDALIKAAVDPFDYVLKLRTGEIIFLETLTIRGDYVHVTLHETYDLSPILKENQLPLPCPRGVDIRVEDIVWCADAPYGS